MLVFSAAAGLVAAGLWSAVQGGGFRSKAGIALMVLAGLLSLTGGTALSRATTLETRAFLGMGPDFEEPASGEGLTALGVFLFVSLPLFLVGGLLFGRG
ncbi:hypothetical protein ACU610_00625 [Geodermatophilus sp. URMC 61]|uniref:hypothetical protein n=1 Tax=Geodermatophilus sp. URMC 61 TaxID=3423411 RepID=UPI00406D3E8D